MLTLVIGAPRVLLTEPAGSLYGAMPRVFIQYTTPFPEPAARAALTLCSRVPSVSTTSVSFRHLLLCVVGPIQNGTRHGIPIHLVKSPQGELGIQVSVAL